MIPKKTMKFLNILENKFLVWYFENNLNDLNPIWYK